MNFLKISVFSALFGWFIHQQSKPVLYIIGDSTVKNGTVTNSGPLWGWGSLLQLHFDTTKLAIENHAIGGRSSRTFINEGRWDKIVARLKKGDYVLLQFGHNDSGPLDDTARARGSISGTGTESRIIYNPKLKRQEEVYTYGAYLRRYVREAKAKGAIPIICSPIPRDVWKDGILAGSNYQIWAKQVATETSALYLPLNEMITSVYQVKGAEKTKLYFPTDHTHTNKEGAMLNAQIVAIGLKNIKEAHLSSYLLR
jgi:rhamnogalacturonan acetylesterase